MPKRRKGKQSSGRSTPSSIPSAASSDNEEETTSNQSEKREENDTAQQEQLSKMKATKEYCPLVLTSEKRRGIYECDYCHSDISQLPRIRCAVCPDFDLCLDCFATTDHNSAITRLKAAANTHSELSKDGIESTMVAGLSSAAANHDHTHGYRVCDSTRYPIFGSARNVVGELSLPLAEDTNKRNNYDESSEKTSDFERESTEKSMTEGSSVSATDIMVVSEDPKGIWTAEEDLRLLDAIKTHGLGNWNDISEAVAGNGSSGKTPKRCMERYFDDFLGRYGHILPPYTIVDDVDDEVFMSSSQNEDVESLSKKQDDEDSVRVSKRRQALMARMPSNLSSSSATGGRTRKRFKVVRTETLPGYDKLWPDPYLPSVDGVTLGQEVSRDVSKKSEITFVKAIADATSKDEADKIREEWMGTKMNQVGAPTVLPPRPEDTALLPGANLMGFMPRRGDFDIEYENDAEQAIADMEFTQGDLPQDRQLKLQVLEIYYQKQEEREKRKKFIMSRNLYDYRQFLKNEGKIPTDERDLIHRLRLFERFHTPEEHKQFVSDILKAKRLRKEIATLQMYRRIGVRSLLEAEKYELDKERRQFHKVAQLQKEAEMTKSTTVSTTGATGAGTVASMTTEQTVEPVADSLWKQYRSSDRKVRRSINRINSGITEEEEKEKKSSEKEEGSAELEGDVEMKDVAEEKEDDKENIDTKDVSVGTESHEIDSSERNTTKDEDVVDNPAKETKDAFDITKSEGFDLLSRKEIALCIRLELFPLQYLEIKKALIYESMKNGLFDKEGSGSSRRIVVKVDVEKRGNILEFMVRAGWISKSLAKVARTVTPTSD